MEHYTVIIDANITNERELFARFTDTVFLGESGIARWDSFYDLLFDRFDSSDIAVNLINADLSGLSDEERSIYLDLLDSIEKEVPGKLQVTVAPGDQPQR